MTEAITLRELHARITGNAERMGWDRPVYIRLLHRGCTDGHLGSYRAEEYPIDGGMAGWEDGHATINAIGEHIPPLTFAEVRATNATRSARWHPPDSTSWVGADWSNAMVGEVGELADAFDALTAHRLMNRVTAAAGKAANDVKKLRRAETGARGEFDPDEDTLRGQLADEIADVVLYLDLLARHYDIDVAGAVTDKFNRTSVHYGFPERLPRQING